MATVYIQRNIGKRRTSYSIKYKHPVTLKTKYFKTFSRLRDAQSAAHDLRSLIDNGQLPTIKNQRKFQLLTFEQAAKEFQKQCDLRLARGDIKIATHTDYSGRISNLQKQLGKKFMAEFTKNDIEDYQLETLRTLSAVSSNRNLFILKQIFKLGFEAGSIAEDVTDKVRYLSEKKHERNSYLFPEELEKLLLAAEKTRAKYYLPVLILLGAEHGASKQELLSLKWPDINFGYDETGIIRFYRTKNGHERTDYLMPRSREALLKWRQHLEQEREKPRIKVIRDDFVFCRLNGEPIKRFDIVWRSVRKSAGFPNLHFHDLRHTFCSNLLLAGADLKRVKEMIGHRDIKMTDRYAHLSLNHKRHFQEKLASHYAGKKTT